MKLEDLAEGDVLANTDENGTSFYRVVKVCQVIVKVMTEQGHVIRVHPVLFDRKLSQARVAELRAQGIRI